ncbi:unnamed protein product [Brugia timori]|uniref:Uncharacterized protein n=1 Tax=Brugia timori TaxID=42155 RepID=A0A0R3QR10_9BILA|nr:unnamed protein product [Brugia timori]
MGVNLATDDVDLNPYAWNFQLNQLKLLFRLFQQPTSNYVVLNMQIVFSHLTIFKIIASWFKVVLIFASELEQVERKRKTLERLRREAQRPSEPDIVVEPQPEPKSVTEAKLRAKLQAKKKQSTELEDDNGPPVPDDLAPAERIPPVLENEQTEIEQQQEMERKTCEVVTGGGGVAGKKKRKGKKGREQQQEQLVKKQSDTINSSIREKLATIAARKERMREIRAKLVQPVVGSSDMDETFRNALQQLKSITEMRKQLELLHEKGAKLPEETAELLERQLQAEDVISQNEAEMPDVVSMRQNSETPFKESVESII